MMLVHCPVLDFTESCARLNWAAYFPFALTFSYLLFKVARVGLWRIRNILNSNIVLRKSVDLFTPWLTLQEALALTRNSAELVEDAQQSQRISYWSYHLIPFLSLVECFVWLAIATYNLAVYPSDVLQSGLQFLFIAFTWFYATARPIFFRQDTVLYDLFVLFCAHWFGSLLLFFDVVGRGTPIVLVPAVFHFVMVTVLLGCIVHMPMAVPDAQIDREEIGKTISPEDYSSLLNWITFRWVYPIVKLENDVYELSPTLQAKPLFFKFSTYYGSVPWHLFWTNSRDILLDFLGSVLTVVFEYASPFFLKKILDVIDNVLRDDDSTKSPEELANDRRHAYIYATAMFAANLFKAQSDVQHLWYGRRASTRIRSELMAAIYDKSLKRVVLQSSSAGTNNEDKEPSSPTTKKSRKKEKKKEEEIDPKSGADVGKIVNLMAVDANRVAMMTSGLYFLYQAPFEIVFACLMLYQLLGWPAFAGFIALILSWPLNSFLSKRAVRIYKALSIARDKRMTVLNELISSVKFIKFFAWEERWIARAMESRKNELTWLTKTPTLISVISFFVYVMLGNTLTVGTAFTAIALFNMIRMPLNVLPTFLVQILQTRVALQRIAHYLQEEEVTAQVSSLKSEFSSKNHSDYDDDFLPGDEPIRTDGLGLENANLKWNEVKAPTEDKVLGISAIWRRSTVAPNTGDATNGHDGTASESTVGGPDTQDGLDHHFELRDISVAFPEGKLSLIVGPTASGKTALLMSLLGEMTLVSGRLIMNKDPASVDEYGNVRGISYAAQLPWLRHQSIKENIIFGNELDQQRYNDVIEACALTPDLDMLEDGDATEIGARVALARAVYARTKYVLLDDPLSAVDSHTSRFLFENLLCGPLLANRTVVLVTHHVDLVLPGANYLVRMLDGRIDTQGSIRSLRAQGILDDIARTEEVAAREADAVVQAEAEKDEADEAEAVADAVQGGSEETKKLKKPRQLVKDEHRETGGVKWSVYKTYLKACSYWVWAFLLFLVFVNQLFGLGERIWINIWGEAYKIPGSTPSIYRLTSSDYQSPLDGISHRQTHTGFIANFEIPSFGIFREWPSAQEHPLFYVGIYAALCILHGLLHATAAGAQYWGALRASKILFKQLLDRVVRATFRFHDTTPAGRLLNRFGKDMETIDGQLAQSLDNVNSSLASFFVSALTIIVVFPVFIIPACIMGYFYRELAIGYLHTGRDLRRMESNSRSPIFSDFGELLEGIVTSLVKVDTTTKMWYTFWMTNRWLLLNFDSLGATAIFCTCLLCISYLQGGAGLAGICITSALSFTSSVYWACRCFMHSKFSLFCKLLIFVSSVERVTEYLDLPQEPPAVIESNRPPAYWPSSSKDNDLLTVEELTVKYSPELPSVLQDVSFSLKGGERVGLLGRTGSGKSTLAMSLLRFVDPASGRVMIDGLDISSIGIQDLRSRITFIPQDATLFSGTLRDNLDPFGEHEDSECLDVLYRVQMITGTPGPSRDQSRIHSREPSRPSSPLSVEREGTIDSVSTEVDPKTTISLSTQVSAGGTNFSQGQRQLIAMARALLRRSSIIILDEATSSIDFATDAKIQATIREEFNNALTPYHYDRLIVLDKGKIVEFDTPLALLEKEDSIFRAMCLKSGTFADLEAAARAKAAGTLS
ncbi:multidrug resistance-associated ABC transporter [Flagelloscypha sp. PMI_526]|nr:multidrug resistance-associated ABC transporter [Flagelloscypha sp. PMI_526]